LGGKGGLIQERKTGKKGVHNRKGKSKFKIQPYITFTPLTSPGNKETQKDDITDGVYLPNSRKKYIM
jgi:hypothetical protein